MDIKKQIELAIARLERENAQLAKVLNSFSENYTEEQINQVLDEILKNKELIEKLKRGL
ncbi:hypothetical protein [Runella sp. SP2]|uniref:hypothetical protein n=1 Tax=Runella sp. SP2 TaxID=2268026 RepID=UPI0013DD922C|nr:hypothetical protein [Runella sp. SP2]